MLILVGCLIFFLGLYLYSRIIRRDKIGMHKFNFEYKIRRNLFIYCLMVGGLIMIIREIVLLLKT
jgi:hypothetical protein